MRAGRERYRRERWERSERGVREEWERSERGVRERERKREREICVGGSFFIRLKMRRPQKSRNNFFQNRNFKKWRKNQKVAHCHNNNGWNSPIFFTSAIITVVNMFYCSSRPEPSRVEPLEKIPFEGGGWLWHYTSFQQSIINTVKSFIVKGRSKAPSVTSLKE